MTFSYNVILVVDVIGTNIMGVDIIGMDSIRVDIILISTDYTLPIGYVKLCCSHFLCSGQKSWKRNRRYKIKYTHQSDWL